MLPIYFNGKFYSGGLNGVHRVADRLIREVDALLAVQPCEARPRAKLLLPKHRSWQPELRAIELVEQNGGTGQTWEQWTLPRRTADGVLVNLANLAPITHRRKILLLHDAQFLFPDSSYPWRQRYGYKLLTPRMTRSSAAVFTVSDYSRQMLDLLGVSPRERTSVLYNGADHILERAADPSILERLGMVPGGYAVMLGSPKAYKNNRVVFNAFAAGALAPLRLVVVGPGRDVLLRAGLRPPDDTVFAGGVDDPELRALYEGAHCLVFPSRTEGFGLPPLEAMLCGCPVVVSPAGAIPEACRDAVLYADVDAPAAWSAAISGYSAGSATRSAKIAAGRARAAQFTWAAAGARLFMEIRRVGERS